MRTKEGERKREGRAEKKRGVGGAKIWVPHGTGIVSGATVGCQFFVHDAMIVTSMWGENLTKEQIAGRGGG
jgi:hypothetical protein